MATCDACGEYENMPYQCRRCGKTFCADHRLPENHGCPGLDEWNDPGGVFDSGFDDSIEQSGNGGSDGGVAGRVKGRIARETSTGGLVSYFRGNATYVLLAAMWLTFLAQWTVIAVFGVEAHQSIFVLHSERLAYVWTWVTAVFSHSPGMLFHIVGNSIVLFFFGPLVERAVGSKRFTVFFVLAGLAAGVGHALFGLVSGDPVGVLGASGATFAILGVLTVWRPNLEILLFFVLPMKLKWLVYGTAAISLVFVVDPSTADAVGLGGIAHLAHLIGLAIGLAYGRYMEDKVSLGGPGRGTAGRMGGRDPRGPGGPGQF